MSEATAVLEEAPPQPALTAPPKLVIARDEALAHLHAALNKGADLKSLRIRNGAELDQARAQKMDWISRLTETLESMFDTHSAAEQCNDWVGRIYPEYAEFGNFVEQFYAEMDHRLKRLKQVIRYVEQSGLPAAPARTPAVAASAPAASVPQMPPPQPPKLQTLAGLIVIKKTDELMRQSIAEFLESLDIEVSIVEETTDMADILDRNRDVSFAVILSGEGQAQCDFEVGFCAGRLGLTRVILLGGNPQSDAVTRGLSHVPIDNGGGWQLQLARHLRRTGLGIDLNRLC